MANTLKFIRVDSFLDDMNREDCFDTQDMDGVSPNYRFILVSDCPQDIEECLDEDGTLDDTKVTILETEDSEDGFCSLLWTKGINGERTISIADSTVTYELGEDMVQIKGIFLANIVNGTGYVLAYCIFDKVIEENGALILPVNGVVWSIRYG